MLNGDRCSSHVDLWRLQEDITADTHLQYSTRSLQMTGGRGGFIGQTRHKVSFMLHPNPVNSEYLRHTHHFDLFTHSL